MPAKKAKQPKPPAPASMGKKASAMASKETSAKTRGTVQANKKASTTTSRRQNSSAGDLSGWGRPKFSETGTVSFPGGRVSQRAKDQEKRKADKPASKQAAKYNIQKMSTEKYVQKGFYNTSNTQEALYPGKKYSGFKITPMRSPDAKPSPSRKKIIKKR
jgi:hypothetical protein